MFPASPRHAKAGSTRKGTEEVSWYRSPTIFDKPLRKVCEAAGVPEISAHALRRTWENLLRQAKVDQITVRATTGHSTETMTEHYSHVELQEKHEAVSKVIAMVGIE